MTREAEGQACFSARVEAALVSLWMGAELRQFAEAEVSHGAQGYPKRARNAALIASGFVLAEQGSW